MDVHEMSEAEREEARLMKTIGGKFRRGDCSVSAGATPTPVNSAPTSSYMVNKHEEPSREEARLMKTMGGKMKRDMDANTADSCASADPDTNSPVALKSSDSSSDISSTAGEPCAENGPLLIAEINEMRANPSAYSKYLEALLPRYKSVPGKDGAPARTLLMSEDGLTAQVAKGGAAAAKEAIAFLQAAPSLPPLMCHEGLCLAEQHLVEDQGPTGGTSNVTSDGATLPERVNRHGSPHPGDISENIAMGPHKPREIVIQWVIDDGVDTRVHRNGMFNPKFKAAGAGQAKHSKYRSMTAMVLCTGFDEGDSGASTSLPAPASTPGAASTATSPAPAEEGKLTESEDGTGFVIDTGSTNEPRETIKLRKVGAQALKVICPKAAWAKQFQLPFAFPASSVSATYNDETTSLKIFIPKPGLGAKKEEEEVIAEFSLSASKSGKRGLDLTIGQTAVAINVHVSPSGFDTRVNLKLCGDSVVFEGEHDEEVEEGIKTVTSRQAFKLPFIAPATAFSVNHPVGKNVVEVTITAPSAAEHDEGEMADVDVILCSMDGEEVTLSKTAAFQSTTLKNMLEDLERSMESGPGEAIPLPNVKGPVLEKIREYLVYHVEHPVEHKEDDVSLDNISMWDREFMDVEMAMLFDLILAANYLDIKTLLDLGCKTVAKMLVGKTPEEIEETFRIPDAATE